LETIVGINLITSSVLLTILLSRFLRTFRKSPSIVVLRILQLHRLMLFLHTR
jgi:hypothetical protein